MNNEVTITLEKRVLVLVVPSALHSNGKSSVSGCSETENYTLKKPPEVA